MESFKFGDWLNSQPPESSTPGIESDDEYINKRMELMYGKGKSRVNQQTPKKRAYPEDDLVMDVVKWYDHQYPKFRDNLFMVNNDSFYNIKVATRNKRKGLRSGVADHFLMVPANGYHGMFIEFKAPGGRQSPNQKLFQELCNRMGFKYVILSPEAKTQGECLELAIHTIKCWMDDANLNKYKT